MKALRVVRHARPVEALEVCDLPEPEPGLGQVRVAVSAASLNWNDIDRCYGRTVTVKPELPFTLGMDVCGVVDAVGEGAERWMGRRVVAITLTAIGGLAESAIAPADSVFDAPAGLDDAEAAAFLIPFHTTHLALFRRARLERGETLLVHAGASGLGSAAIQLGAAAGARVIATARSAEKVDYCRDLGAEQAIDAANHDFVEGVFDFTEGRGADVVLDLAGGGYTQPTWKCTAREGRYVPVGFADDPENGLAGQPLRPIATGNFSVVGVMLAWITNLPLAIRKLGINPFPREVAEEVHADLLRWLSEGKIRVPVERRVSLDDAAATLAAHEASETLGRSVVEIGAG